MHGGAGGASMGWRRAAAARSRQSEPQWQRKSSMAVAAVLLQSLRLCNNCTGTRLTGQPTLLPPPWPQPVPTAVPRLLSPPFLVMTGGCRQAAVRSYYCSGRQSGVLRRKSRDISPVMTVINLEPSLLHLCPSAKNPTLSRKLCATTIL